MYATATTPTHARRTDTRRIQRDESNRTSTIHCELLQPLDLSGGKQYTLITELSNFVEAALNAADTYRPQNVDFNTYNREELKNWGIHGFLHVQLYEEEQQRWIQIDLRKGTPVSPNPKGKKKEMVRDTLSPLDDYAMHMSKSEQLGKKWSGIAVTIDTLAAPLMEKYSKPGEQKKREGEVTQQINNILWNYISS